MSKPRNPDADKRQSQPASPTADTKTKKPSGAPIPGELTEDQLAKVSGGAIGTPTRKHSY
jgi:hypothetical protein